MSQHDYNIANGGGAAVRSDINSALGAIQSLNSGTTAPTTTVAGMLWYDTLTGSLKQRNSGNTAWVSAAEFTAGGQLAGLRNLVINGAMKVDQRNNGVSQTITAGAALAYTVDRWYAYCAGANVTGIQFSSGALKRYRFTGAASVTGLGFGQRIEAASSMHLANTTASLSVKASSSSLTTLNWAAYYASTADSFGTVASPTRTLIASGSFTINSTEANYSAQISVPAAATTGIEILFTGGALLGTQTLTIGDVQLEPGGVATTFEQRPYGMELYLCYRYFQSLPNFAFVATSDPANVNARTLFAPMRASPTMTGTPASGTGAVIAALAGGGSAAVGGYAQNGLHSTTVAVTGVTASAEL